MSPQHTTIQVHRRRPVRGVLERPRRRPADKPASDGALAVNAASQAAQPRPLRRWSVAQLIAQAVARPPGGGLAH